MTSIPSLIGGWFGGVALMQVTQTVANLPPPLTEFQIVVFAIVAGFMGGLVASLSEDSKLTKKELLRRVLSSGMVAPAIVVSIIIYSKVAITLLPVVAISGVGGLIAWPIASGLPKLAFGAFRSWLSSKLPGDKS